MFFCFRGSRAAKFAVPFLFFVKGKNLRKAKRHNNMTETWHLRAVYADESIPMVPLLRMVKSSIMYFYFLRVEPVNK